MSHENVTSSDGTVIAFETTGKGVPLVLVGGALCDRRARASGTPLAALLADRFTVVSYDRRGRGDSRDTPPYASQREVEDLAAVLGAAGGSALVFGNSSGGLLALDAAVQGLALAKLAVFEPPVLLDAQRATAFEALAKRLADAAAGNRRSEAVELFMTDVVQMPEAALRGMKQSPMWSGLERLANTLSYDVLITSRGPARLTEAASVRPPTLVMDGSASPPWMRDALRTLASAIPSSRHRTLEGQTHDVNIAALAAALGDFFEE